MASASRDLSLTSLLLGFLAGAIAVVTAHEAIIYVLTVAKLLPPTTQAWSLAPYGPFAVPTIVNRMFWGGLLGALFAAIWPMLPGGAMWLRGLIYGLLVVLFSNWLLVPFVKGTLLGMPNQAYFGGMVPARMLATLIILASFGLGLGLIHGVLRNRN